MDAKVTLSIKKEYLSNWELFEKRHPRGRSEAIMRLVAADNKRFKEQKVNDAAE